MNKELDWEKVGISLPYYNLMLEVTRKCNLTCSHCMRGDPQNLDMSDEILEKIFGQVEQIYHLSLTGGEPFLAPHVIEKMVDIIIEKKIRLGRCTTVDNGTILNDLGIRCVKALNRLADYIYNYVWNDETRNDPEESPPVSISISNSIFHKNDIQKAIDFYKTYANRHVKVDDQGEWETGLKDKHGNVLRNKDLKRNGTQWVKKEGRAKDNNIKNSKYMSGTYLVELMMDDNKNTICVDTGIQVCANGNVVMEEPLSFETMDKINMGNGLEEPVSCMIYKWNWIEPLKYNEVALYCHNMTMMENPNLSEQKRIDIESGNTYLDLKKYLFVEGHKDYPYLTHEELAICVAAELALMMCEKFQDTGHGMSETEIIEKIIRMELTGEYATKFTKADLKRSIDKITARNFERAWQKMNIIDYIKYVSKLRANAENQIDTLSGDKLRGYVYEK